MVHQKEPWIIDWPQAVDVRKAPRAHDLLARDLTTAAQYFIRRGLDVNPRQQAEATWRNIGTIFGIWYHDLSLLHDIMLNCK